MHGASASFKAGMWLLALYTLCYMRTLVRIGRKALLGQVRRTEPRNDGTGATSANGAVAGAAADAATSAAADASANAIPCAAADAPATDTGTGTGTDAAHATANATAIPGASAPGTATADVAGIEANAGVSDDPAAIGASTSEVVGTGHAPTIAGIVACEGFDRAALSRRFFQTNTPGEEEYAVVLLGPDEFTVPAGCKLYVAGLLVLSCDVNVAHGAELAFGTVSGDSRKGPRRTIRSRDVWARAALGPNHVDAATVELETDGRGGSVFSGWVPQCDQPGTWSGDLFLKFTPAQDHVPDATSREE